MEIDFSRLYECINPVYHPYIDDFRRIQIFKGGGSAGKSKFIAQRTIYRMIFYPGYNGVCIRNANKSNHSSTFAELCKIINQWGLSGIFKINRSQGNESITCLENGNTAIFRGLDDPEKVKSITLETGDIVWIWVEEASEIDQFSFNQLLIRIRGAGDIPKHIILSFNPIDIDHWIKARFFDNPLPPEDGFICESTHLDNEYLTTADRKTLLDFKNTDYYYYKVYALNQWGSLTQSRVFENIEVYNFDIPEWRLKNVRAGMDFGWNHYQAFIRCGYLKNELYIFSEVVEKETLNTDFIELIKGSGFPLEMPIVGDNEDPGAIEENNRGGLTCYPAIKGPGSVDKGVKYLRRLPKIHIHATNCPQAARQFQRFKYREDKHGKIYDGQYVDIDDDTVDATRYANEEFYIYGQPDEENTGGGFILTH